MRRELPTSAGEAAALLAEGHRVRPIGGGTKLDWGAPGPAPEVELSTERLDRLVAHNEGDLTAVLEAGVPIAKAQERFAAAGQRLALDPPDGEGRATLGGIVATGDSGPLRHRYGGVRDLILGVRVALADGTVARAGSNVIKNVAGYDLAKLMCGSLGALGVVCEVTLRLHPLPERTVTVVGRSADPQALAEAAQALTRLPLEVEALDVRWDGPEAGGCVLARAAGRAAEKSAGAAAVVLRAAKLHTEQLDTDIGLWEEQRERQRARANGAVVRISGSVSDLEQILSACPEAVARPSLGLAWARIDPDPQALAALRAALAPAPCVLLDGPEDLRAEVDPWGLGEGPELTLMRRVKARFDPAGVCNSGRYVGGI